MSERVFTTQVSSRWARVNIDGRNVLLMDEFSHAFLSQIYQLGVCSKDSFPVHTAKLNFSLQSHTLQRNTGGSLNFQLTKVELVNALLFRKFQ